MEIHVFRSNVEHLVGTTPETMLTAYQEIQKFRENNGSAFLQYCHHFLSSEIPLQKIILMVIHEFIGTDISQCVDQNTADVMFSVVFSLIGAPDNEVARLAAIAAADLAILKMEKDGNVTLVPQLLAHLKESQSDTVVCNLVSIIFDIMHTLELSIDDQVTVLTDVMSQLSNPICSVATKVQCLKLMREVIGVVGSEVVENEMFEGLCELLFRITFDPCVESWCFHCWTAILSSSQRVGSDAFGILQGNMVEQLMSSCDTDILDSIVLFVRKAARKLDGIDLSFVIVPLMRLIGLADLNDCDDYEGPSATANNAIECLKQVIKASPEKIMPLIVPLSVDFEHPVHCLVALYHCIVRNALSNNDQLAFIHASLVSDHCKLRYLAMRCVRAFVEHYSNFRNEILIGTALMMHTDQHYLIICEFHRILAIAASYIPNFLEFCPILLNHLVSPIDYISGSANGCMKNVINMIRGDTLMAYVRLILDVYGRSHAEHALEVQHDLTSFVQTAIFALKMDYGVFASETLELLMHTLNCGDPDIEIEAITPIGALAAESGIDLSPILPHVMEKMLCFLQARHDDEDTVNLIANAMFFYLEKCEMSPFVAPFINTFIQILYETGNINCIVVLSDMASRSLDLLRPMTHEVVKTVMAIEKLWPTLTEIYRNELFVFMKNLVILCKDTEYNNDIMMFAMNLTNYTLTNFPVVDYDAILNLYVACVRLDRDKFIEVVLSTECARHVLTYASMNPLYQKYSEEIQKCIGQ